MDAERRSGLREDLAAPAHLVAIRRRTRIPAVTLLLAAPVKEWHDRHPGTNPLPWTVACIADDAAYGLGVWRGCLDTGLTELLLLEDHARELTTDPITRAPRRTKRPRPLNGATAGGTSDLARQPTSWRAAVV